MGDQLPVETPVLVNEVDGQTHERVAGSWRPHVGGEGGTSDVSLDSVDDIKDLLLDLGRLHLHQLWVGGPMLQVDSLVEQFQQSLKWLEPHHSEGDTRLSQKVHNCVIQLLAEIVNILWKAIFQPHLLLRLAATSLICRALLSRFPFGFGCRVHFQELLELLHMELLQMVLERRSCPTWNW